MKYTREQLGKMNDFEVNKALAEKLGFTVETRSVFKINVPCVVTESGDIHKLSDYCNSWDDIMPLAVEHGINLTNLVVVDYKSENQKNWVACESLDADWDRVLYSCGAAYDDDSPQRAIACCLLLMELK